MATTDTDVSQLVINKLTKAQYDGITTPSDTELYFVDDGKTYATTDMLATVATSGSYTDLTNKPTIPAAQVNSDWDAVSGVAQILNKPSLATVATSGSYSDLSNKPTIPTKTSDLNNDSGFITSASIPTNVSAFSNDAGYLTSIPTASANTLGGIKVGAGLAISSGGVLSATGGGTADAVAWGHITGTMSDQTDLTNALAAKVDSSSLATVATSGSYNDLSNKPTIPAAQIQSDWTQADNTKLDYIKNKPSLATVATSGSYNDLSNKPTIPTVNDATLTIQKNGTSAGTFTANASSNKTINITVPTTAADVSALPASTKYGASIAVSINTTDYKVTTTLKDQDGNTLGTAQVIDLPLESVVVNGSYDNTNKKIILTLQNGSTIDIPVADLVSGLQTEITSSNKLDADLVDDSTSTHKFTTASDISKLAGIAAGAEVNVQSDWNQTTNTADDYIKNKPSLAAVATSGAYSDLSGAPSLATVATSGSYNDLSNKPTIPAAQVNSDWNAVSGKAQILNKPTLATVATSGSYNDLSNKPSIPAAQIQSDWTQATTTAVDYIKNKPNLATVATSGSYNDLSNKPTIPAAQVNSDWDAVSGVAQILNKPTLATVATSGSYNDLSNKPTIPTVNNATLTIQKNGTTVKTFTANASSNVTANITVPTTVAELSDSSDYATTTDLAGKQDTLTAGDHIDITGSTIKAEGYVHSENPQAAAAASSTITGSMIASGTITADKLAPGATVQLTLSTSDIGEGSPLAANTLYGVYI